jgi:hypothetical protein
MNSISAVVLFAEDVREEKSGQFTLIGIISDNMLVPGFPGLLPKLAMYVRVHIPVDWAINTAYIYIENDDGLRALVTQFDADMIDKAQREARSTANPIAGMMAHVVAAPFAVERPSRTWLTMDYGQESFYLGSLNFVDGSLSEDHS